METLLVMAVEAAMVIKVSVLPESAIYAIGSSNISGGNIGTKDLIGVSSNVFQKLCEAILCASQALEHRQCHGTACFSIGLIQVALGLFMILRSKIEWVIHRIEYPPIGCQASAYVGSRWAGRAERLIVGLVLIDKWSWLHSSG